MQGGWVPARAAGEPERLVGVRACRPNWTWHVRVQSWPAALLQDSRMQPGRGPSKQRVMLGAAQSNTHLRETRFSMS